MWNTTHDRCFHGKSANETDVQIASRPPTRVLTFAVPVQTCCNSNESMTLSHLYIPNLLKLATCWSHLYIFNLPKLATVAQNTSWSALACGICLAGAVYDKLASCKVYVCPCILLQSIECKILTLSDGRCLQ